jgi:hypothetical protein
MLTTKVFAKAGLDNVTSATCKHQQRFGLDVKCSAFVFNFNFIFSIGHLYRAGRSMNSLPSQILNVSRNAERRANLKQANTK